MTTLANSVSDWVNQHPQTARVFETLQIDYCCGGKLPLEEACAQRGLDATQVVDKLQEAIEREPEGSEDWLTAPLTALCDHVEQTHHARLKQELPRMSQIIAKVVSVHGEAHPELPEIAETFQGIRSELESHMFKEEKMLFPSIRKLDQASGPVEFPFGSIANPIQAMEAEHDLAGDGLERIRSLTQDFTVPFGACNTYRAMLHGLHEFELDMHQHVHKENNILFPRAIEMEQSRG